MVGSSSAVWAKAVRDSRPSRRRATVDRGRPKSGRGAAGGRSWLRRQAETCPMSGPANDGLPLWRRGRTSGQRLAKAQPVVKV